MSDKELSDEEARAELLRAFTEALKGPMAAWELEFGVPSVHATPGAVLRVPDAVLRQYGVPSPASVCVLRIDDGGALNCAKSAKNTKSAKQPPPTLRPFHAFSMILGSQRIPIKKLI